MSFRLFKTPTRNTVSDHIKDKCDRETIRIENTVYNLPAPVGIVQDFDHCYHITQPYTNIKYSTRDYTLLRKYRTIYSNRLLDHSNNQRPRKFFNGEINSSMYLENNNANNTNPNIYPTTSIANTDTNTNTCNREYTDYIYGQNPHIADKNNDREERILYEKLVERPLPENTNIVIFPVPED